MTPRTPETAEVERPPDWKEEMETAKSVARAAGASAFSAGLPHESPSYGRGDLEACWRLGWKRAAAAAGNYPEQRYLTPGSFNEIWNRLLRTDKPAADMLMDLWERAHDAEDKLEKLRETLKEAIDVAA